MKGRYFTKGKRQEEFLALFAREGMQAALYLVLGFVLSNTLMFKTLSPMGVALCGAASGMNLYAAVAGAIVGYSIEGAAGVVVKYIGAVVVTVAIKWLGSYLKQGWIGRLLPALSAGVAMFVSGGILTLILTPDLYSFLSLLIEAVFAGVGALLFSQAIEAFSYRRPVCRLSVLQITGVMLMIASLLISAQNITVGFVTLGSILAGYLTLTIALNSGGLAGACAGVVFGVALSVFDESFIPLCAVFGFGGFLSGSFNTLGKSRMTLIYFISSLFLGLIALNDDRLVPLAVETAAAAVAFLAFGFSSEYLKNIGSPEGHPSNLEDLRAVFDRRVALASESLSEIGDITKKVSLKLDRRAEIGEKKLFEKTAGEICGECSMHDFCWDKHRESVKEAFESLTPTLRRTGYLTAETLPSYFLSNCIKSREVMRTLNVGYSEQLSQSASDRQLSQVRQIICEQFDAMSMMLTQLREELATVRAVKSEVSDRFAAELRAMGLTVEYCCASERDFERITVEVCITKIERESVPDRKLMRLLDEITGREFDYPTTRAVGDKLHYVFNEKPCFDLDYKVMQTALDPSNISGDSCGCFTDAEQFFNVILSDGMGAGKRAAVDSAMTVSLITKLIKSGFHYDNAIDVVNSAMLVKSGEETLSTVDALRLDLYTGKLQLLKAGAAPTFIYRKGERVHTIEGTSLPIGILGGVRPEKNEMYLKSGDLVVMVTDGVCDDEFMWLEQLLMRQGERDPKELCDIILKEAIKENGQRDDCTVLVARVIPAYKTT